MSTTNQDAQTQLTDDELVAEFLRSNVSFIGPDNELLSNHHVQPRTPREQEVLEREPDIHLLEEIRTAIQALLDEEFEIVEKMVVSPAAGAGDMTVVILTAQGDLSIACLRGVVAFAGVSGYPVRYALKHFGDHPGIKEGEYWISNDVFYGGGHSPDQMSASPVFHEGELIAWVAIGMHEGENGAKEPGGMGPMIESPWDEGIRLPPVRFTENHRLRPDFLNYLQNSSRDPILVGADLKVRLAGGLRMERGLQEICAEYGPDNVIAALRQNVESLAAESARRIAELPEGTVRTQLFVDTTMREDALIRLYCEITIRDGKMHIDLSGSAPQLANRPINTPISGIRVAAMIALGYFVWPDLPRSLGVLDPIEITAQPRSLMNATPEVPTCLSLLPIMQTISLVHIGLMKLGYGLPQHITTPMASWFNQPVSFIYGGLTQHQEVVGNLCAEVNGMAGGARCDRDGEHSLAPSFAAKVDTGETESAEEKLPFLQLIARKILPDNCGYGKFRGGSGFEFSVANKFSQMWGFSAIAGGSRFPSVVGLFGGYGSRSYAIAKIEDVNVFDELEQDPSAFESSLVELMNKRPFASARYSSGRAAMPFGLVPPGTLFMQSQGAGGGFGDVLDRDPALVMKDLDEGVISHRTAEEIYQVRYDRERLVLDLDATARARQAYREQRLAQSQSYDEFVAAWTTASPPEGVPYYGGWGADKSTLWANGQSFPAEQVPPIMLPDPRDVRIAQLEARLADADHRQ
jgi:acetone carboxylase, alpha subunit